MTAPTRRRPRVTDCRAAIADRVPVLDDCDTCRLLADLYDATGVEYRPARTPKGGTE